MIIVNSTHSGNTWDFMSPGATVAQSTFDPEQNGSLLWEYILEQASVTESGSWIMGNAEHGPYEDYDGLVLQAVRDALSYCTYRDMYRDYGWYMPFRAVPASGVRGIGHWEDLERCRVELRNISFMVQNGYWRTRNYVPVSLIEHIKNISIVCEDQRMVCNRTCLLGISHRYAGEHDEIPLYLFADYMRAIKDYCDLDGVFWWGQNGDNTTMFNHYAEIMENVLL